jgi:hypothetical protein
MSAAHDDREPQDRRPSTDVSDAEAEAVASETSADQIDDVGLVAPTSGDASSTAASGETAGRARGQDEDAAEPEEDRRHLQQGSGQASPSFGEQQQRVPPTP